MIAIAAYTPERCRELIMEEEMLPRVGLTIGKLRQIIANLPDDMDVRMMPSIADECHVMFAEVYKSGTLLLSDVAGDGAGAEVVFDRAWDWRT